MEATAIALTRPGFGIEIHEKATVDEPPSEALTERYEILEEIGKGGMGVVYRARHRVLHREFAVKLLRPRPRHRAEVLERFRREALSASSAGSPHVVQVTDFGELPDGSAFLAMEMLDGRELADDLLVSGPLSWARTRHILLQICAGLRSLHAQGIVHRDLKPENVLLLERDGHADFVKLVDFGLAKIEGAKKITAAGLAIGTPHYMSPEQCLGEAIEPASDVYSLGVVMYQMLSGRLPFEGVGFPAILAAQVGEAPDDVRVHAPDLSSDAAALVMRCLEKNPAWRPVSVIELAAAIEAVDESSASSSGVRRRLRRPPPPLDVRDSTATVLRPARGRLVGLGIFVTSLGALAVAWALAMVLAA